MREVYLIIKDKLLEKFTMSNMIYEAERHIEEIQMKQIAFRQHDETVNEFLNIIRNNTTTKCIQLLRELTSSFDHIDHIDGWFIYRLIIKRKRNFILTLFLLIKTQIVRNSLFSFTCGLFNNKFTIQYLD